MKENIISDDGRQYLEMMQNNIARMASNSANCKTWMVTIVAAMTTIHCSNQQLNYWIFLVILPVFLFWYLDTFYLHIERGMRNREKDFINQIKLGDENAYKDALYNFAPKKIKKKTMTEEENRAGMVATDDRMFSASTAPFYGITMIAVVIISLVLNWATIAGWFNN